MAKTSNVGFIGTGAITAAVVAGLCSKPDAPAIHLSPRSEASSKALAARFANVHRESSNAQVVAKSQIVVLAVRPEQLSAALSGISFRKDQIVVSFVATVELADIAKLVAPASTLSRVTPLTFIEKGRGPIVMAPPQASVQALFEGLGDVLIAESEEQMMAYGCAASMLSTFFEFEHAVAQWLTSTGVKQEDASLYVRSMFAGLASTALENPDVTLGALAAGNETPGGLNERVRVTLRDAGMFQRIAESLSDLSTLSLGPRAGS